MSKQQNNKQKRVLCLLRKPQNIPHLSPHRLIKGIRDSSRWFQEFPWTSSFSLILVFHRLYLLGLRSALQAQFGLWIFEPGFCIWSPHRFTLRFLQHLWSLQCWLPPAPGCFGCFSFQRIISWYFQFSSKMGEFQFTHIYSCTPRNKN